MNTMMEESKNALELISGELKKAEKFAKDARTDFLTFVSEYKKEDGSIDFDKLAQDNKMNDYKSLERFSEQALFESAMVKDYIRSNSEVAFLEEVPMGFDFNSIAARHDEMTKDARAMAPSLSKIEVTRVIGQSAYTYNKAVGEVFTAEEEAKLYRGLLDREVAKVSTTKLGSPAFDGVKTEACTAIVISMNKEYQEKLYNTASYAQFQALTEESKKGAESSYADPTVNSQTFAPVVSEQQALAVVNQMETLPQVQPENTMPGRNLGGFTATGLIALITGIVSIGLIILGTMLIK